jgi:heparanase
MIRKTLIASTALFTLTAAAAPSATLELGGLTRLGTVSDRYQAYNIEMVEVTGGRFWAPYGGPPGEVYRQRPPIDLTDPKLIALARNLGPSLMRVSGTWSNNTYLETPGETLSVPPEGFKQVLTRNQWKNVVAFSKAVDAPIVTSFAVSLGTRGPDGVWKTDQAQRFVDLTREAGGSLYAAEFFNEPDMPGAAQGMPAHYNAANYAVDFRIFRDWARKAAPEMKIVGPGGVGEGTLTKDIPVNALGEAVSSEDMMKGNPGSLDAASYHFYGSVSQRCAALKIGTAVKADALSPAWLDRTLLDADYYGDLRDKYEPGKPLWNTETAQAACGGSPWASTFLDSFRYLNQLGALAQRGVQVVMHNTLAASDYALVDRDTLTPRPSYWAAVLWRRTMGSTVLAAPRSPSPELRLYAHCLRETPGGVGLVALNTGSTPQSLRVGQRALGWTLQGQPIDTHSITINGRTPGLDAQGNLTGLGGAPIRGAIRIPAQSIAFVAVRDAGNPVCR